MIQEDTTDPVNLFTVGELRQWLESMRFLPDSTPIAMDNPDPDGEEFLVVAVAKRTWRPGENGAAVYVMPDGSTKQDSLVVLSLRCSDE